MTPEDTLKFYRFLTDETGVYAKLRKSTGIDNPVKLIRFELGNEVYHDVGDKLYNPDGSITSSLVIDYSDSKPFEYDTERLLTTKRSVRKVCRCCIGAHSGG